MKYLTHALLVILALGAFTASGHAQSATRYATRQWSTADGMPQNTVTDVAIASDGFIYLSTFGGLARFNGERFESEDLATNPDWQTSRLGSVAADGRGNLYLVTTRGMLFRKSSGHWERIRCFAEDRGAVFGITIAHDDSLWIAAAAGLFNLQPKSDQPKLVQEGNFFSVAVCPSGEVYASSSLQREIVRIHNGEIDTLDAAASSILQAGAFGDLYFGKGSSVFHFDGSRTRELHADFKAVKDLSLSGSGGLYILTYGKLFYKHPDHDLISEIDFATNRSSTARLRCIAEDTHGNLWIGTEAKGLLQISRTPLSALQFSTGQHDYIDHTDFNNQGQVMAIGLSLWRESAGQLNKVIKQTPLVFCRRKKGGFWIVDHIEIGVWKATGSTVQVALTNLGHVQKRIHEAQSGSLWIATPTQLIKWDGQQVERYDLPGLAQNPEVLIDDDLGRIWLGRGTDILTFDGTEFKRLESGHDMPFGMIRSFQRAGAGAMWAGTYGSGIFHIAGGKVSQIDTRQGLAENTALAIVDDLQGHFVVLGNSSVARYGVEDLEALVRGETGYVRGRIFNSGPGIHMFEGNGTSPISADSNGLIWLSSLQGLARFDVSSIPAASAALETHVEVEGASDLDYQSGPHNERTYTLPKERRFLNFNYTAASFILPRQVAYRFRLKGLADSWLYSHDSDLISFRELPPGDYTFEIQSAEAGGPFGPVNDSIRVHVPPTLLEQRWFLGLLATLLLAIVVGLLLVRGRTARLRAVQFERKVEARTEELSHEVKDRKRIEEELRVAGDELEYQVRLRTDELATALTNLEWDMLRREKLEGRLRQSEKLEAVGRLAGGLAHDFNNILTAILGEADLAQARLDPSEMTAAALDAQREHLANVRNAGLRAANLTRQLLAYSRQQVLQPRVVDPLETLADLQPMLRRLIAENVVMSVASNSITAPVLIDPGQLEQVIVNLVVNASESMPEGGSITMRTRVKPAAVGVNGEPLPEACVLEVSDTGVGLSTQEQVRIFEPFFSTKGQGRGLGLASVQGIIAQSNGTLEVLSTPGKGTTFHIELPVTSVAPVAVVPASTHSMVTNAVVLLVDDEIDVRRVANDMLAGRGFQVIDAGSPEEALELAEKHKAEISVLVTDVVMPHMNGKQLSVLVREICPTISVLFISGYSAEVLTDKDLLDANANLLAKPFDSKTLAARVAELTV